MKRRAFFYQTIAATALATAPRAFTQPTDSQVRVAVVGLHGRGKSHIEGILASRGARLVALCDVDAAVLSRHTAQLKEKGHEVLKFEDYRELCASPDIDAITVATPNHTHALIGIEAAKNGKHVYVEKPVSHNVWEGRQLALAQAKHGVMIQHGFQRRAENAWKEAFAWIAEGHLGGLVLARGLCYKARPPIGRADSTQPVPAGVNYDLWAGPRPTFPIDRRQFHYDWHWQFPWGNGDLGNQGPHQIDICRWALGDPGLPLAVSACGNRFAQDDDGDWPNSIVVHLDYREAPIVMEVRGLPKAKQDYKTGMDTWFGESVGNLIEYEGGMLVGGHGPKCRVLDKAGQVLREFSGGGSSYQAWIDSIHSGKQDPILSAESGHLSSALAHLGNISWEVGQEMPERPPQSPETYEEAIHRMEVHLQANGIDFGEIPLRVGPRLPLIPEEERFADHPLSEPANALLKGRYRAPFEIEI